MSSIIHISRPDSKGSGTSAYTLHTGLLNKNVKSQLIVLYTNEKNEIASSALSKLEFRIKNLKKLVISFVIKFFKLKYSKTDKKYPLNSLFEKWNTIPAKKVMRRFKFKPDIIIFYFLDEYLGSKAIFEIAKKTEAKLYWYIMDMSALTGGCNFAWDCDGYKYNCGKCPAIFSSNSKDLTFKNLERKKKYLININLDLISNADWQINNAKKSILFKNKVIHKILLPVNPDYFFGFNKNEARKKLGLDRDKKIILFGAESLYAERKGVKHIFDALNSLYNELSSVQAEDILLLVIGHVQKEFLEALPFNYHYLGRVDKYKVLPLVYQSSTFFLSASLQDNGPYTIEESIKCNCPVVSYNMGLAYEFVITGKTGYNARLGDVKDLTKGIKFIIDLEIDKYEKMTQNCKELADELLNPDLQIKKIMELLP